MNCRRCCTHKPIGVLRTRRKPGIAVRVDADAKRGHQRIRNPRLSHVDLITGLIVGIVINSGSSDCWRSRRTEVRRRCGTVVTLASWRCVLVYAESPAELVRARDRSIACPRSAAVSVAGNPAPVVAICVKLPVPVARSILSRSHCWSCRSSSG